MINPKPCSCGNAMVAVWIASDKEYHVVCLKCGKSGPKAANTDSAIAEWNKWGDFNPDDYEDINAEQVSTNDAEATIAELKAKLTKAENVIYDMNYRIAQMKSALHYINKIIETMPTYEYYKDKPIGDD